MTTTGLLRRDPPRELGCGRRDAGIAEHRPLVVTLERSGALDRARPLPARGTPTPDELVRLVVCNRGGVDADRSAPCDDPPVVAVALTSEVLPWRR